ncbi:MAG: hypothetical protein AB7V45_02630 [Candidatus Krumholzibacteriia bacterium]
MATFTSVLPDKKAASIIAVDLGYSASRATCGVVSQASGIREQLQFGKAVALVVELVKREPAKPVVVLEGVLSTRHEVSGNPVIRGEFERGRGWYWGPGAVSLLAALRFLGQLEEKLGAHFCIPLAEAFLSNKSHATRHSDDANEIAGRFGDTTPESIDGGCEPILRSIKGVPAVRVFCMSS